MNHKRGYHNNDDKESSIDDESSYEIKSCNIKILFKRFLDPYKRSRRYMN